LLDPVADEVTQLPDALVVGLTKEDFAPQVEDVITVGDFYGIAAGGEIVFT
jgi:hypothetical protein